MAFKKGDPKPANGGRKKGVPNKVPAEVKVAVQMAFEKVGGYRYLMTVAEKQPQVFCTLLAKIIPTEVKAEITGANGGPLVTEVVIEHHAAAPVEPAPVGSGGRETHAPLPPGPVPRVAVDG
jgi:hypothetical protein